MKETIIIHNPTSINNRYFRDYNLFWDELTEELKKKYNVIENREFENSHSQLMQISLSKGNREFLSMMECEYVIENADNGDFYILSVADQISSLILDEQHNPNLKKVLYSQYVPDQIVHHTRSNFSKYSPWIYFPQNTFNVDEYFEKRNNIKSFNEKLYFKGTTSYRPIVNFIDKEILCEQNSVSNESYLDDLIQYKIALSIGGLSYGDLCYRDIEYMSLGIPFIKFNYVSTLNPGLIPNYHYISIDIPEDLPSHNAVKKDRLGVKRHAELIEKKYKEVIRNENFLKFISKNSKEYYEKYLSKNNRVKYTLNLLGL
jgi:hypothetical protein